MDLSASDATAPSQERSLRSGAGHDAGERLAVEQPVHDALREALRGRRARAARELQQPRHFWRAEQYEFACHPFSAALNTLGRLT